MIQKKVFLILITLVFLVPIQVSSQGINLSLYSASYNVKIGDFKEYKEVNLQKGPISSSITFDNKSYAIFNITDNLILRFTVAKINQTNGQQQVYLQESTTTYYEIIKLPPSGNGIYTQTKPKLQYGTITSQLIFADVSGVLHPAFPNETMIKNYLTNTTGINSHFTTNSNYYTVTSSSNVYPFNDVASVTVNWKTGWLQELVVFNVFKMIVLNKNFISSLANSPLNLIAIGFTIIIISALTILIVKYKKFKTQNQGGDKNISLIDYTKGIVKSKNKGPEHIKIKDIDKSLHTLEEIIDENKQK